MTSLALELPATSRSFAISSLQQVQRLTSTARLLVVEDDADLRNGLTAWLRHQGYDTIAVRDGIAGLRVIEKLEPDLMVLDLGLPRMHGFMLLHQLRLTAVVPPRTIVLTAASSPDIAAGRCTPAPIVFTKPADPQQLLQAIDDLLRLPS